MKRNVWIGSMLVALFTVLGLGQSIATRTAAAQAASGVMAPRFEVDPSWPKPLPNGYYLGQTIGVSVDAQDHVWIVHRPDVLDGLEAAADSGIGACCKKTPPILEFNQAGNLLRHWGGQDDPRDVTSGPRRITASGSTTRATSGSAATAARTAKS